MLRHRYNISLPLFSSFTLTLSFIELASQCIIKKQKDTLTLTRAKEANSYQQHSVSFLLSDLSCASFIEFGSFSLFIPFSCCFRAKSRLSRSTRFLQLVLRHTHYDNTHGLIECNETILRWLLIIVFMQVARRDKFRKLTTKYGLLMPNFTQWYIFKNLVWTIKKRLSSCHLNNSIAKLTDFTSLSDWR